MTTHVIEIEGFEFKPKFLEMNRSDRVKWINRDGVGHSAERVSEPKFDTGQLGRNESSEEFSFEDFTGNRFEYFCGPHPHMTGEIVLDE